MYFIIGRTHFSTSNIQTYSVIESIYYRLAPSLSSVKENPLKLIYELKDNGTLEHHLS